MTKLRIQNNGSFKKSCVQAKDIRRTMQFLKEDIGPHKVILRFLEKLECTSSYREPAREILHTLRTHLQKCGDTSSDIFEYEYHGLSLGIIRATMQDCRLDEVLEVTLNFTPNSLNRKTLMQLLAIGKLRNEKMQRFHRRPRRK